MKIGQVKPHSVSCFDCDALLNVCTFVWCSFCIVLIYFVVIVSFQFDPKCFFFFHWSIAFSFSSNSNQNIIGFVFKCLLKVFSLFCSLDKKPFAFLLIRVSRINSYDRFILFDFKRFLNIRGIFS